MDLIINNLRIPIEDDGPSEYARAAAQSLQLGEDRLKGVRLLSKSLDARSKKQFHYEISLVASVPDDFANRSKFPVYLEPPAAVRKPVLLRDRPIVVGFGPAGIFAALELLDHGLKPLIFDRGKCLEERDRDLQRFLSERILDPESNIQFGEGGAGTYSDGKLFSRIKAGDLVDRVLNTFIKFGAPAEIGYVNKPHLGTDVLREIVRKIRHHLLERGGEIHFGAQLTELLVANGQAQGVVINGTREYRSSHIYLAVGHSARDTFAMLLRQGVALEQKPIAVGVRIEHPVEIINRLRYGRKYQDFPALGAANYAFACTPRESGRGVYSFCMCPGGEVLNAASEEGLLAVNGMSNSRRDSPFSNAAIVVACRTEDYGSEQPLAGIEFQRNLERRAFAAAGGNWQAPAQNLMDFLAGRPSPTLNQHSYRMGAAPADLATLFPDFVGSALRAAFRRWQQEHPWFVSDQAILFGVETRTSSPVKIRRGANYQSVSMENLYPIGEGSGYAGGITSSAVDAIQAVTASLA